MKKLVVFLSLLILAPLCPVSAQTQERAVFDVTAAGFSYGDMTMEYREKSGRYEFIVESQARGILGFLTRSHYTGSSRGRVLPGGKFDTDYFQATSHRLFKNRDVEVTFRDARPDRVSVTPRSEMTFMSDPAKVPAGRIDSLSYLARMLRPLGSNCPGTGDLYDGRRMSQITFTASRSEGGKLVCTGTYRIVKGPDHTLQKGKRQFGLSLVYKRLGDALELREALFVSGSLELLLVRR